MAKMYENLDAWKEATNLAVRIYQITRTFPKEEIYGVTSQIRRAAVSISSNIAEGAGRKSKKDFQQFVHVASGSLNEVESILHVCFRLDFVKPNVYQDLKEDVDKVGRLIGGLIKYLNGRK